MPEGFDYGPAPYMYEPEYTDEELIQMESEAIVQEQVDADLSDARRRHLEAPHEWCKCNNCAKMPKDEECLCCAEFYLWSPDLAEDISASDDALALPCITASEDFAPMINRAVLETFFSNQKNKLGRKTRA